MNYLESACQKHWLKLGINDRDTLKDCIRGIFDQAQDQEQALIGIYRLVLPDWDRIEKIHGYPAAGEDLWQFICREFMQFDKAHHPSVMAGGAWMNTGFSVNKELAPWEISFDNCSVDLLPDGKELQNEAATRA